MEALWPGLQALLLATLANTVPIVAKRLLGARWAWPLDGGLRWFDGRPLLGPSKTWRGLLLGTVACALAAPVLELSPAMGAAFGALALAGDVLASFLKRRLGVPPSGQAFGLDQVPEVLLPQLVLRTALGLSWPAVAVVTLVFLLLEGPAARLWYRLGLRDRPY